MKKQLIAVGLAGLLTMPAVSFGAEMAGASLYGSFRAGLKFGSGDGKVSNYISRWGIKGSVEVSEGLTAAYKYEAAMDLANAETAGGNDSILASTVTNPATTTPGGPLLSVEDLEAATDATDNRKYVSAGGPGGRLSYVSLSGGFGTITVGQIWSASYNHYGAALDPTWFNGSGGGTTFRIGNAVSYSSSAGDVSFQIDKVTGDEMLQFGATAALGPVGVGLGYWSSDDASFTGLAFSTRAGGVGLAFGLGNVDNKVGKDPDTSLISVSGALGDSGFSYGVQVANSDEDSGDQNLVSLVNTLGPGVAIHFEHLDPAIGDASSHIALRVDF